MSRTTIEWTEMSWNPVTGCSKVSAGCKHCYAERFAKRLQAMGNPRYRNGFKVALHPDKVSEPHRWKSPRMVFVNSMSDLFHEEVPVSFIQEVFRTMSNTPRHTYQILTKRAERAAHLCRILPWPENVWMGVSIENHSVRVRLEHLRDIPARIRFLSLEPLLGPLPELDLRGIHWVIVGGESGPHARPMKKEWVTDIRDQCETAGVAFFFKQWGGIRKHENGRELDGREWNEMPELIAD